MKKLILAATILALPALSHAAVFTDNFDGDTLALNQTTFLGGWTVSSGTVDLIGQPGFFEFFPGNGRYVDLDGSTRDAGLFDKQLALAASTQYILSFDLAGSQRADTNIVDVIFGTSSQTFTLASADPFATYTMSFTTNAAANYQISFQNSGTPGDNIGALLDNVSVTAVPEPETYALMLAGLGLVGFAARRKQV
ncbi:MAG TPA: FxDxF family PEP-CTERM protein [Methylotenera sp.]|nr:FxDxF family PEP-CTERM protein [Methylotenera sp.]HPH04350.1 FxDxF family PEP-CTERM protein [Methylotenera sp.]HPM99904.1 FxDxF family PEP-CTERM protein [Methylotenera sp.]